MASLYHTPLTRLNKIGPKKAEQFAKLGIDSVGTLLRYYPRTYEDWSHPLKLKDAPVSDPCCIRAVIVSATRPVRLRGNMTLFRLLATDGENDMTVTFFNQPYLYDHLRTEQEYLFYGTVKRALNGFEMSSPQLSDKESSRIRPIYPQSASLSSKQIANAMEQAIKFLPETINDPIPENLRRQYELPPLGEAIRNIHFPESYAQAEAARKRFVFEELLILQLGIGLRTSAREPSSVYRIQQSFTEEFLPRLPFKPTNAQRRVIEECVNDMLHSPYPMNRLLQGDVGSGKTAVAAAVCYTAVKNGLQCAFMAPTEILAEQHFRTLQGLLDGTDISIALLTGSTRAAQKRRINDGLITGAIQLVIGTHALLSDNVSFRRLGLVITDEQHRFGVSQRAALTGKGDRPHTIVMSATPIPRTLALMIFGDLELSVLDELPPGRQKIDTYLVSGELRERLYRFMDKQISEGRQCYIVCPLVEQNESELNAASDYIEKLQKSVLRERRTAVLHGKLKPAEKESIMTSFAAGEIDILIATTVIEVGVDVPNATVMLIENAERFGLSQLHQLRGRVGRGSEKSYCVMISDSQTDSTLERLNVMCQTNDGFKIADEDLRLRGPGDFFGTRQHGLPELKTARLTDMLSLEDTRSAAQQILQNDPLLEAKEHRALAFEVKRLFRNSLNG